MKTATAIKAIRRVLRRKGTTAELRTSIGPMPTTKAAVSKVLDTLGELSWVSEDGNGWSFRRPGDDDAEAFEDREGLETTVHNLIGCVTVYA